MTAKDMIRANIALGDNLVKAYLGDLTDAELALVPVEGMNPIAWQIGHLIAGEKMMVELVKPNSGPALPEGFNETYGQGGPKDGVPFPSKEELMELWKSVRAASLAVIDEVPESKFGDPSGVTWVATVGELLNMVGNHTVMHAGQWVAVRRKLKKPIAI